MAMTMGSTARWGRTTQCPMRAVAGARFVRLHLQPHLLRPLVLAGEASEERSRKGNFACLLRRLGRYRTARCVVVRRGEDYAAILRAYVVAARGEWESLDSFSCRAQPESSAPS